MHKAAEHLPAADRLSRSLSLSQHLSARKRRTDGPTPFFCALSLLIFAVFSDAATVKLTNHGGGIDGGEARREADEGQQGQKEQAGHHLGKNCLEKQTNQRVRQLCHLSRGNVS